jgi:hypothetical protein
MCRRYETLAKTKSGVVQWCYACESFHVGFGTFHITLRHEQLSCLKSEMDFQIEDKTGKVAENEKFFFFTTESDYVRLAFTLNEMKECLSMVTESLWLFNTLSLLSSKENEQFDQ